MFFIIISALHVSGGFSAHHQELIKLYVQLWVLSRFPAVYRWCGWGGAHNQRDASYTMFFIIISALHVSGGFSAHHQELIKLYVQLWVLSCYPAVYRWCGWVVPSTPAVDSRKA